MKYIVIGWGQVPSFLRRLDLPDRLSSRNLLTWAKTRETLVDRFISNRTESCYFRDFSYNLTVAWSFPILYHYVCRGTPLDGQNTGLSVSVLRHLSGLLVFLQMARFCFMLIPPISLAWVNLGRYAAPIDSVCLCFKARPAWLDVGLIFDLLTRLSSLRFA